MSEQDLSVEDSGDDSYVILRMLLQNGRYIIGLTMVAMIITVIVSLRLPNIYTATVSAVPPRKTSSTLDAAMSSVSSTLREFGLTKIGGKKGESFDFMVLLQSRQVQDSLIAKFALASVYELPDTSMAKIREELSDRFVVNLEAEGNYTVSIDDTDPKRAAEMANYVVSEANELSARLDKSETEVLYRQYQLKIEATDRQIAEVRDSISRYGRMNKLFSPADQAKAAATALAELKSQKMKAQVAASILEATYGKDDPMTQQQNTIVRELQAKEIEAEGGSGFLGTASLSNAAGTALPYVRMTAELEALIKLKAFLLPSFEQVKLDLNKLSPSLYIVDEAQAPDKKSRPKRSLIVLGATLGTFFLGCLIVLVHARLRSLRRELNRVSSRNPA
ncbi:MAG: GNVR domain-containing protein [Candidatus Kapaibacterium sp.]|jgi:tyrosine-protein kinase Etk/Wzc